MNISASNIYSTSQVDGILSNKANSTDAYTKDQVYGMIPMVLYGIMKFSDDDTGTGRGVISHPTALQFCINPVNQSNGHTDYYVNVSRRRRCIYSLKRWRGFSTLPTLTTRIMSIT